MNAIAKGSRVEGKSCSVLGMRVDQVNLETVTQQVLQWAGEASSRYLCISTVHMVMESHDDGRFRRIVNEADLVAADGMPIIWVTRLLGLDAQERVFAPEITDQVCAAAAIGGIPVGFFGSSPEVIADLTINLAKRHAGLQIAFAHAPPFRPLTAAEDAEIVRSINESGVRILFVGLGCPKQERWMSEHRGQIAATMLGVGWAFDVLAGHSRTAPGWVQRSGLEWVYRLVLNPRKLWKRHLKHNPRFVVLILNQLLRLRLFPISPAP
jgi:N-acetylglucosaminyldiphosphoundecaprenol N-acetyl-beta-D-mannosaminyltransferase